MRLLKENDYKTLTRLCSLSQEGLKSTLSAFLKSKYKKVVETEDYIFAEGDIPIALVAHMDTVNSQPPTKFYYDRQENVIWTPYGPAGFDDRAGVFAILQILRTGVRPHIIFTTDEESGAFGATELSKLDCPFADLRYVVELDRRGADECVFYDCENPDFTNYIENFGFVEAMGSFTDICMFCETWKIAGVNLSIGYKDEHSKSEILFVGHMLNTIDKVLKMLHVPINEIPKFEYIPAVYSNKWWHAASWASTYADYSNKHCYRCGTEFAHEDMIPVKMKNNIIKNFCIDCLVDGEISWCKCCGEAFEPDKDDKVGLCNDCKYEFFGGQY